MAIINKVDTVLLTAISKIMGVAKAGIEKFNKQLLTAPSYSQITVLPDGDVSIDANWNASAGSLDYNLLTTANDAYAYSTNNTTAVWEVSLSDPTDTPYQYYLHELRVVAGLSNNGTKVSTGSASTLTIELLQGSTVIATESQEMMLSSYTINRNLTLAEMQSITNYNDLRIKLTAVGGGGSPQNRRGVWVDFIDFRYYVGTPYGYTNNWDTTPFLASYVDDPLDVIAANPQTQTELYYRTGSFGTAGWNWGTIMASPNGNMYCIPYYATQILRVEPFNKSYALFGSSYSGNNKWHGAALTNDGTIYCNPRDMTYVLKIADDESVSTFGSFTGGGRSAACSLAPNGKIYAPPWLHTAISVVDTSDDSVASITGLPTSSNGKWSSAVLAPNGYIYCAPRFAANILKIDPSDNSYTTIGTWSTTADKYNIGKLANNGKIYFSGPNTTTILVIDTTDDSYYTVSCNQGYNQVEYALNGYLYFTGGNSYLNALKLDLSDDSVSYVSAMSIRTAATKVGHDGFVYGAPGTDGGLSWFLSEATPTLDKLYMRGSN